MDSELKTYLEKYGIEYVEHQHDAVFTVEESKKLKKEIPGMHCKTLFLKGSQGKYYLIVLPAEKRLDNKKFRKLLGVKKAKFGNKEELEKEVRLTPGSVSIFGAIYINGENVKLIIDKEVWSAESVGFHPNINTATIVLEHEDLKKFYDSLDCEKEIVEL